MSRISNSSRVSFMASAPLMKADFQVANDCAHTSDTRRALCRHLLALSAPQSHRRSIAALYLERAPAVALALAKRLWLAWLFLLWSWLSPLVGVDRPRPHQSERPRRCSIGMVTPSHRDEKPRSRARKPISSRHGSPCHRNCCRSAVFAVRSEDRSSPPLCGFRWWACMTIFRPLDCAVDDLHSDQAVFLGVSRAGFFDCLDGFVGGGNHLCLVLCQAFAPVPRFLLRLPSHRCRPSAVCGRGNCRMRRSSGIGFLPVICLKKNGMKFSAHSCVVL